MGKNFRGSIVTKFAVFFMLVSIIFGMKPEQTEKLQPFIYIISPMDDDTLEYLDFVQIEVLNHESIDSAYVSVYVESHKKNEKTLYSRTKTPITGPYLYRYFSITELGEYTMISKIIPIGYGFPTTDTVSFVIDTLIQESEID